MNELVSLFLQCTITVIAILVIKRLVLFALDLYICYVKIKYQLRLLYKSRFRNLYLKSWFLIKEKLRVVISLKNISFKTLLRIITYTEGTSTVAYSWGNGRYVTIIK